MEDGLWICDCVVYVCRIKIYVTQKAGIKSNLLHSNLRSYPQSSQSRPRPCADLPPEWEVFLQRVTTIPIHKAHRRIPAPCADPRALVVQPLTLATPAFSKLPSSVAEEQENPKTEALLIHTEAPSKGCASRKTDSPGLPYKS
jgi:hypothetical protein